MLETATNIYVPTQCVYNSFLVPFSILSRRVARAVGVPR